jgi:hypothetical protein
VSFIFFFKSPVFVNVFISVEEGNVALLFIGLRDDESITVLSYTGCRNRKEKNPPFPLKSVAKLLKIDIIVCCIMV